MSYPLVLLAFGAERIGELLYSKRNERAVALRQPNAPQAGRSVFNWLAAINVALFTVPVLEHRLRRRPTPRPVSGLGWVATITASLVRLWVVLTLRSEWNVRAIVPTDVRVTDRGPYRFIRHPNYLALGLEFAGIPLIGGAYLSAAALTAANALLLSRRISEEEGLLMAIPEYRARMGPKPRFIPRLVSAR